MSETTPAKPQARAVLIFPDPKLYEKSRLVDFALPDAFIAPWGATGLEALAADLVATVEAHKAAGISAVQVGVAARVIVIVDTKPIVMVNPTWRFNTDEPMGFFPEGCLSFPGIMEKVDRHNAVEATWTDLFGFKQTQVFKGVPAQAIQHECEHLEGKLFIEHLPLHKRTSIRTAMKQHNRKQKAAVKAVRNLSKMTFRSHQEMTAFLKKSGLTAKE